MGWAEDEAVDDTLRRDGCGLCFLSFFASSIWDSRDVDSTVGPNVLVALRWQFPGPGTVSAFGSLCNLLSEVGKQQGAAPCGQGTDDLPS